MFFLNLDYNTFKKLDKIYEDSEKEVSFNMFVKNLLEKAIFDYYSNNECDSCFYDMPFPNVCNKCYIDNV